ncbi:uncharacterized protein LOC128837445 isoform X2 [Malaclemys terrapin pileata]|uniref:uncharacterized protein LOC128837445 isoform X2 n=1 Tax=Malaclemys terrapin pileata TaxID=2991368 RepID=UPI0023A89E23|nr:uncharacterized protein LOC128837445 isoform X2 [Malaclemys terrapin pileata]
MGAAPVSRGTFQQPLSINICKNRPGLRVPRQIDQVLPGSEEAQGEIMTTTVQPLPKVIQKPGCSAVLQNSPTSVWKALLEKATHLQTLVIGPETDTNVTLNIINGQKSLCLEADLHNTVDQIKKWIMLEGKFGDSGSIRLLYGNQELQGPKTLGQHRVTSPATLFIVHKCTGG